MSYSQAERRVEANYVTAIESKSIQPLSSINSASNFVILIAWLVISPSLSQRASRWSRLLAFVGIAYISCWNLLFCRSIGIVGSIGVGLNSVLCVSFAINLMFLHDIRTFKRLVICRPSHATEPDWKWESIPTTLWRRLFWTFDLITSIRGVQWSSSISSFVWPRPPNGKAQGGSGVSLLHTFLRFLFDYMLIDIVKCLMISDPYFLGFSSSTSPTPSMKAPLLLYTLRMLLAATGTWVAIDLIVTTVILIQTTLSTTITGYIPLFPQLWGSPRAMLTKGLRGFWGETWHQLFRMHFASIGDAVAEYVLSENAEAHHRLYDHHQKKNSNGNKMKTAKVQTRPQAFVAIRVVVVFLLSGAFHAAGSYTLLGPTRPWSSFLFFALQPIGIGLQIVMSRLFSAIITRDERVNRVAERIFLFQSANLAFTLLWLWGTCWLLADDMSVGGMWLFEPVPVSLGRGFGFSREDGRFWCW